MNDSPCLAAALGWCRLCVGVVPVLDLGPGNLVPGIRWQDDGPLLDEVVIRSYWDAHPDAQLAITLDNSAWGGPRLLCIDDDSGKHDTGQRERPRPLGGYRESTRSGGTHDVVRIGAAEPPGTPTRVTGVGGFVDILVGGILFVAPTVNRGKGEYRVIASLGAEIPEYNSISLALDAAADWLCEAWQERACGGGQPTGRAAHGDFAECYRVAVRTVAAGDPDRPGLEREVQAAVACDHPEWSDANIGRTITRIRRWLARHPLAPPRTDEEILAEINAEPPGTSEPGEDDPDSEPAEPLPTDLVVAYEEAFAPDWSKAIHRMWRNAATGRPTHACTPRRLSGWSDADSNRERILRLLRDRKAYLAARGNRTVRAYVARGLPFDRRRRFGPRGVARRVSDWLRDVCVDRWVVCVPGGDGAADVFLFVFDRLDDDAAQRVLERANAALAELYGMETMRAHPFRRDRHDDGGKLRLPLAEEVDPDVEVVRSRALAYPVLNVSWAKHHTLSTVRRYFLRRLALGPVDAPRFRMGVAVAGEWSGVVPSFHPSTLIDSDDVPDAEVDPSDYSTADAAEAAVDTLRNRHRLAHEAFLESEPRPEDFHLQACDDCDAYCAANGVVRPLPSERPMVESAEYWGHQSEVGAWHDGYDPPPG